MSLSETIQRNTEGIEPNDITKNSSYCFDKDFQNFDSQDKTNDQKGGETFIFEDNDDNYKDNSSINEGLISPEQLNQTQNKKENVSIDDEDQKIKEGFFKNCNPLNNVEKLSNDNLFKKQEDSFSFLNIKKPCIFPPSPPPDVPNNNCNIEEMTPKKKIFSIEKKNNNQKIPPKSSQSIISNNSEDKKTSKFLARKTKYGRRKNYPDDMKNKLKVIFQNILLKL